MTAAALENVQAHVLRPASRALNHAAFCFLTLDDPAKGRALLARLLDGGLTVSDADGRRRGSDEPGHPHVAVGFTRTGLRCLGQDYAPDRNQVPEGETDPFCVGMAARRKLLGDPDTGGWGGRGRDMLLWIAYTGDRAGERSLDEVRDLVERSGFSEPHVEEGSHPGEEPVVLGFKDGTSQPFVSELASSRDRLPGGGTVTRDGWCPVPLGEFVLGSTDAGGERLVPQPAGLAAGGTFLVFRRYAFDGDALSAFLAKEGKAYDRPEGPPGAGSATVAAKVVGRYRVGESPAGWPDGYDAIVPAGTAPGTAPLRPNDFRYGQDTYGHSCPLGAHIRRANPRDALGFDGRLTVRHRIIRRGVPWDDGTRHGLHFVAVNARIHDQFEFIQRQWLNTGSAFRLGSDIDLLAGSLPDPDEGSGEASGEQEVWFVIQGTNPRVLRVPRPFSQLQGGDYYLMPGMAGLRTLAGKSA